jgi:hypothetical protein
MSLRFRVNSDELHVDKIEDIIEVVTDCVNFKKVVQRVDLKRTGLRRSQLKLFLDSPASRKIEILYLGEQYDACDYEEEDEEMRKETGIAEFLTDNSTIQKLDLSSMELTNKGVIPINSDNRMTAIADGLFSAKNLHTLIIGGDVRVLQHMILWPFETKSIHHLKVLELHGMTLDRLTGGALARLVLRRGSHLREIIRSRCDIDAETEAFIKQALVRAAHDAKPQGIGGGTEHHQNPPSAGPRTTRRYNLCTTCSLPIRY